MVPQKLPPPHRMMESPLLASSGDYSLVAQDGPRPKPRSSLTTIFARELSVNDYASTGEAAAPHHDARPTAASWRACVVLSLSVLFCMSTWLSASVVLGYLEARFGVGERDAPLLTIAVQGGFVACAVAQALTQLPDRANCRWLMCGGGLLAVAANLAMLACRTFGQAVAARTATGVAMALVYPPSTKVLATWFATRRGLAMSFLVGAISPGSALPNLIEALPGGSGLWASRRGFVLLTYATSLVTLVGALMPVALVGDGPHPFPRAAEFRAANLLKLARNGPARLTLLAYCGHNWELYGAWSWIPRFLSADVFLRRFFFILSRPLARARGGFRPDAQVLPSHAAAAVAFAAITMGGVAAVSLGSRGDAYGRAKFCAACSLVSCACDLAVGACGAAAPPAATAALVVLWGFSLVPDSPQYATLMTELVDPELVGTALVVTQALGYLATMPSIFLIPRLQAVPAISWRFTFAFLAPGAAAAVCAMLRLDRLQERRKRAPSAAGSA